MDETESAERTPAVVDIASRGGPRTPEGRAKSSLNATRHGLAARVVVLPGIESAEAWEDHRVGVIASLDPRGAVETTLAARVAELLWRLQRAGAAEAAMAAGETAAAEWNAVREALAADRAWALATPGQTTLPAGTVVPVDREEAPMRVIMDLCGVQAGDGDPYYLRNTRTMADLRNAETIATGVYEALRAGAERSEVELPGEVARNAVRAMTAFLGIKGDRLNTLQMMSPADLAAPLRDLTSAEQALYAAKRMGAKVAPPAPPRKPSKARAAEPATPSRPVPTVWCGAALLLGADRIATSRPGTEGVTLLVVTLVQAREIRDRARRILADAQRRLDLATVTATTGGVGGETVRRYEAHLQRQLASTLAMLRAVAAARPALPANLMSDEELNRRLARLAAKARGVDGDTEQAPELAAIGHAVGAA